MKRFALKLALFLLLGALLNVVVAWRCAIFVDVYKEPSQGVISNTRSQGYCDVGLQSRLGATVFQILRLGPYSESDGEYNPDVAKYAPSWARRALTTSTSSSAADARGWPSLSMVSFHVPVHNQVASDAHWCITTGLSPWYDGVLNSEIPRVLPLHPIWAGFAINTIFYAAILWLLLAFPFSLRRRRRIGRGLCPKCAYDLRGGNHAACPECGKAVKRQ